jgi:Protein of unknown function (DUF2971)
MATGSYNTADLQIVTDVLNRLRKLNHERENTTKNRLPENGQLFHYTAAEGLKGIIEKNELWASSAYFLNDSSEIMYGYGVLKEVLEGWIKSCGRDEYSMALGFARGLLRGFGHDLLSKNIIDPIYLACFCEEGNLLSQWRAYGQTGGYSLAFNFRPFDTSLRPEPVGYTSRLIKVEYDRPKQLERCRVILQEVLPIFDDSSVTQALREVSPVGSPNRGFSEIGRVIREMLMEEALAFKDKAFEVEREWRLVVRRREDDGGRTPPMIHFRLARGLLIPYIRLIPAGEGAKIPLAFVRSGPTIDGLLAFLSLRPFLDRHGFKNAGTKESGISARF